MWPGHYNKQSWQAPSSAAADGANFENFEVGGYMEPLPQQNSVLNDFNFTSNLDHLIGSASSIYASPSTDLSVSTQTAAANVSKVPFMSSSPGTPVLRLLFTTH
jgi:hypothetical protein